MFWFQVFSPRAGHLRYFCLIRAMFYNVRSHRTVNRRLPARARLFLSSPLFFARAAVSEFFPKFKSDDRNTDDHQRPGHYNIRGWVGL